MAKLSPEQIRDRLARAGLPVLADTIARVPREQPLPLSFGQQRLWFLSQLDPESVAYNHSRALRLRGVLDVTALRKALSEVVGRHEILRTRFVGSGQEAVQRVQPADEIELPVDVLPTVTSVNDALREAIRADVSTPFALSLDMPFRVRLLRVAPDDHVLILTFHHIAGDAWSMPVLLREVSALYTAFCAGAPSPLPPLPIQYADYASWQRAREARPESAAQLAYWQGQLAGLPNLRLPRDGTPEAAPGSGAQITLALGADLSARLRRRAREEGVTLFMLLLAAFEAALAQRTQQERFAVGTAVAGRIRAELEPMLGCFINMLALRADVTGQPTFRELVARVRETCLGAFMHQETPFERVVEALAPDRVTSHAPVFQVAFGLRAAGLGEIALPGLHVRGLAGVDEHARYELTLWAIEGGDDIRLFWTYRTDLFSARTITALHDAMVGLLTAAGSDMQTRVAVTQTTALPTAELRRRRAANRDRILAVKARSTLARDAASHSPDSR